MAERCCRRDRLVRRVRPRCRHPLSRRRHLQPIAANDVAASIVDATLTEPRNGLIEIAGPERAAFNEIVARYLKAVGDPRQVVSDPEAQYWRAPVEEYSLVPLGEARLGRIHLDQWIQRSKAAA